MRADSAKQYSAAATCHEGATDAINIVYHVALRFERLPTLELRQFDELAELVRDILVCERLRAMRHLQLQHYIHSIPPSVRTDSVISISPRAARCCLASTLSEPLSPDLRFWRANGDVPNSPFRKSRMAFGQRPRQWSGSRMNLFWMTYHTCSCATSRTRVRSV